MVIRGKLTEEQKEILLRLLNSKIKSLQIVNSKILTNYDLKREIKKLEEIKSILEDEE